MNTRFVLEQHEGKALSLCPQTLCGNYLLGK